MAAEVVARERALRAQVSRLQVVIDRTKVDQEIAEITDADFFQGLERRAEALRGRAEPSRLPSRREVPTGSGGPQATVPAARSAAIRASS